MILSYKELKSRQREERDDYPLNLGLRVHRALSWLNRAEQCDGDLDAEFIFLWIAYNAAYANEIDDHRRFTEQVTFQNKKVEEADWLNKFQDAKNSAHRALGKKDTGKVLAIVFSRLYTLRNQFLHGGAT